MKTIATIELTDEQLVKVVGGCGYERRDCDDGWRGSEYGDRGWRRSHREHDSWSHDVDDVRINIL